MTRARTAGFTLIELMITLGLVAVVVIKITMVLDSASQLTRTGGARVALEDQARAVLDRIAEAVLGASRELVDPDLASPLSSAQIGYRIHLGVEAGEVVWSAPEQIGLDLDSGELVWRRNPGAEDELRVAWSRFVRPYLAGELANGIDDNGNGLVDERGLSFDVDRDLVTIRLTLARELDGGGELEHTVTTMVVCRN